MAFRKISLDDFIDTKRQITDISSKRLVVLGENAKLIDVLNIFFSEKVRKIPIVDKFGNLKGMVSSIDVLSMFGGGEKHEILTKNRENMKTKVTKFATRHVKTIHFRTPIKKSLETFKAERSGLYPLVDSKKIISVVSEWDFVKLIDKPVGIRIGQVMVERPIFVQRDYNVHDVAKMMCRGGFRRLPVVEDNILLGIVTPTDILLHLKESKMLDSLVSDKTRIEKIMNREVITADADADLFSATSIMASKHVGGLPVTDEEELIGIVTERDIVDALI